MKLGEVRPLAGVLEQARASIPRDWLYVQGPAPAEPATPSMFIDLDDNENREPPLGWRETIDGDMIRAVVERADLLAAGGRASPELLMRAFNWCVNRDAFLPSADAREPTREEDEAAHLQWLRRTYDGYGNERPNVPRKYPECGRGPVYLSVFCRVHHFQQVMNRACPFNH